MNFNQAASCNFIRKKRYHEGSIIIQTVVKDDANDKIFVPFEPNVVARSIENKKKRHKLAFNSFCKRCQKQKRFMIIVRKTVTKLASKIEDNNFNDFCAICHLNLLQCSFWNQLYTIFFISAYKLLYIQKNHSK